MGARRDNVKFSHRMGGREHPTADYGVVSSFMKWLAPRAGGLENLQLTYNALISLSRFPENLHLSS